MKKWVIFLFFLLLSASPIYTDGHVKWFADLPPEKIPLEEIISPLFMTVTLLTAVILAVLSQVADQLLKIPVARKINAKLESWRKVSRYLLKYGTAVSLIIQVFSGSMFAPEFHIEQSWQLILMWAIILALLVPHHISTKIGAVLMLGLFSYVWGQTGWFHMLDYGFYIAIIAVLLVGKTKWEDWGFPFLYLGMGLSLCWVAIEKWVYPGMTVNIIEQHNVPTFGFDPEIFIVLAAFIEFVVGYLLIVGILNRILALVVTVLFILTTTIFGSTEIVGHSIIHIILIIFIIEGVSFYHPPIKIHKTRTDQMVFVFLNFIFALSTFLLIYYRFA